MSRLSIGLVVSALSVTLRLNPTCSLSPWRLNKQAVYLASSGTLELSLNPNFGLRLVR